MLNLFTVVGKVKELPVIKETSGGNQVCTLVMECERPFRNSDGTITNDEFKVTLWKGIAQTCIDSSHVGSVLAVKGRLQDQVYKKDDDHVYHNIELVAEKISFIS